MERGNTKQEILVASLELFSVQGFEATSISQIADAVGIRKASLYSHFESKQAILDALIKDVLEQYGAHDPEIMAAQFCLPISVWINLCDREPDREPEIMELVDKHIRQFFKVYQTKE